LKLAGMFFGRPTNWEPHYPPISMFVSTPAFAVAQAFVARIGPLDQFVRCADRASPPPSRWLRQRSSTLRVDPASASHW